MITIIITPGMLVKRNWAPNIVLYRQATNFGTQVVSRDCFWTVVAVIPPGGHSKRQWVMVMGSSGAGGWTDEFNSDFTVLQP